jgi:DNA repair photolyase
MALTKSKGNMYSWVTHLWSPIKGCQFGCDYCYAKKYGYSNDVELDEEDLRTKLGRGKVIFVCHLSDMWGPWILKEDIARVLARCRDYPENVYVFQSKNPIRFKEFFFSDLDVLLGTTIETDQYPNGFKTKAPPIEERFKAMRDLLLPKSKKFVTIEPIMRFSLSEMISIIKQIKPEFLTLGADSKNHRLVEPTWKEIQALIFELSKITEIRQKTNLQRLKR